MLLGSIRETEVVAVSPCPAELLALFVGPWAQAAHGGPPRLWFERSEDVELPPDRQMFIARGHEQVAAMAVYLTDTDLLQRRSAIHLNPVYDDGADRPARGYNAVRGLVVVGAFLGDMLGVERFWTQVQPGREGLACFMGFEEEGRLVGHALSPGGREDILLYGASWAALRKKWHRLVSAIEWAHPMGQYGVQANSRNQQLQRPEATAASR